MEEQMQKVRIGIIGCGGMARHHGKMFTRNVPDAEIVALAEPNENNLARFIKEVFDDPNAEPATFSDYRQMLKDVELDGVIIISPHAYHFQQAVDSISAGCHVLIEKPMVISTPDAQALIEHAAKHGKHLSVAFPGPFTTEFQYIRDVIARGELGEISLVSGHCCQQWVQGVGGTWRTVPELSGGGNLYDSGAHMFNAMLYLTGLSATEVFALVNNKDQLVDVEGTVTIRFNNGALGTATVSGDSTYFEQGIYIQGTKGTIKTSIYGGSMEHWQNGQKVKYPVVPEVTSLQQNFVDLVRDRTETPSPAILGLRQARLMDAIYESAKTGKLVSVVAD
jgi:predicted dehydrogenase